MHAQRYASVQAFPCLHVHAVFCRYQVVEVHLCLPGAQQKNSSFPWPQMCSFSCFTFTYPAPQPENVVPVHICNMSNALSRHLEPSRPHLHQSHHHVQSGRRCP